MLEPVRTAARVTAAKATPAGQPADAVDDTAETAPDTAATITDDLVRRAEVLMLKARLDDQDRQAQLDSMRSEFDFAQQQRAELLREMNILRDMALEQMKKDDEVVKKWIALI